MKPIQSLDIQLEDDAAERTRRNHDDRIKQVATHVAMGLTPLGEVALADGIETTIAHKLGRAPVFVFWSPPRGAVSSGRVEEIRSGIDRSKVLKIKASGYGGPIKLDLAVM